MCRATHPSFNKPRRDPASSPSSPHYQWLAVGIMAGVDLCNSGRRGGVPPTPPPPVSPPLCTQEPARSIMISVLYAVPAVSTGTSLGDQYMHARRSYTAGGVLPPRLQRYRYMAPARGYMCRRTRHRRRRAKAPLAITAIPSPTRLSPSSSTLFFRNFQWTPLCPRGRPPPSPSPRPGTSTNKSHLPVPRPGVTSHPRHIYLVLVPPVPLRAARVTSRPTNLPRRRRAAAPRPI